MNLLQLVLFILVIAFIGKCLGSVKEGWGSSPATLIQLSASSGYYPFWRFGHGYRYPYYRYMYPNNDNYTAPQHANFPKPQGSYKYY